MNSNNTDKNEEQIRAEVFQIFLFGKYAIPWLLFRLYFHLW